MLTHWVFNPSSPQALSISTLFIVLIIVAALVVLFIAGVLAYTCVRFRARPGNDEPPQMMGNVKLEITWTAIPLVIVAVFFVFSIVAMNLSSPGQIAVTPAVAANPNRIHIIAHQWWWEVRYPSGAVTANEIHIASGKRYLVSLDSDDVIHDFWVPQCGPKLDMVPGQTNYLWLECDGDGTYAGACAQYCGAGHAWMLLRVIAQPAAQFDAWVRHQRLPAVHATSSTEVQGQRLFQALSCQSCHALRGVTTGSASRVTIGPDLTHVGSRQTLAGGRLPNTLANLEAWLHNPDQFKPGVHMPNFQLDPTQNRDLSTYLESLT